MRRFAFLTFLAALRFVVFLAFRFFAIKYFVCEF